MLEQEHGLPSVTPRPSVAALATFVAFVVVGSIPLAPFAIDALPGVGVGTAFAWSACTTGIAFFLIGTGKAVVVEQSWWRSGLETLLRGGSAAALAYAVGAGLGGLA
jgi:VIT1/CCC1 family predicted Fe2+/Mn2+ transporter